MSICPCLCKATGMAPKSGDFTSRFGATMRIGAGTVRIEALYGGPGFASQASFARTAGQLAQDALCIVSPDPFQHLDGA